MLGLYELSEKTGGESEDGKSELWAAKLAVEHVNKRKLFGGYELEFYTNDTKVGKPFFKYVFQIILLLTV